MVRLEQITYAIDELRENYDDRFWRSNRIGYRLLQPLHQRFRYHPEECVWVMEEDWDNLIILDACRADLFEEVVDLSVFDNYHKAESPACRTDEWVGINFADKEFGDTVYVTANLVPVKVAPNSFHDIITTSDNSENPGCEGLYPGDVVKAAKRANEKYPNKKLIIHFVQPHVPFLPHPSLCYAPRTPEEFKNEDDGHHNVWAALARGDVERDEVWAAYGDNLNMVIDPAVELAEELGGKSVVTADHGNMVGEYGWPLPVRLYGHGPRGLRCPELVNVPWASLEMGERRTITDEGVRNQDMYDDSVVNRRLQMLGYRE